jgi:hypothetical protein
VGSTIHETPCRKPVPKPILHLWQVFGYRPGWLYIAYHYTILTSINCTTHTPGNLSAHFVHLESKSFHAHGLGSANLPRSPNLNLSNWWDWCLTTSMVSLRLLECSRVLPEDIITSVSTFRMSLSSSEEIWTARDWIFLASGNKQANSEYADFHGS